MVVGIAIMVLSGPIPLSKFWTGSFRVQSFYNYRTDQDMAHSILKHV